MIDLQDLRTPYRVYLKVERVFLSLNVVGVMEDEDGRLSRRRSPINGSTYLRSTALGNPEVERDHRLY